MSIELLPPDPQWPDTYHARPNWCRCHPETCCCKPWALHGPDGTKIFTCTSKESAEEMAGIYAAQPTPTTPTGDRNE